MFKGFGFCTQKRRMFQTALLPQEKVVNYIPTLDVMSKHYRKFQLEQGVIDFRKVILEPKRIREISDHLDTLHKNQEVAAVIEGREEFSDIDVVFDLSQIRSVKRRTSSNVAPVYVRLEQEQDDIRCVLNKIERHPIQQRIYKIYLQRYIVGRPNLMYIPIQVDLNFYNKSHMRGSYIFTTSIDGVWVNCYNNIYPTQFNIDPRLITQDRPYNLGDLQNSFPDGIELHERYKKLLHRRLAYLERDEEESYLSMIQNTKEAMENVKKNQEIAEQDLLEGVAQKKKKVEKKKKTYEKSLKKKIAKLAESFKGEIESLQKKQE